MTRTAVPTVQLGLECGTVARHLMDAAMPRRTDALFEVADAPLSANGPVQALVEPAPAPAPRRSHAFLCATLNQGGPDAGEPGTAIATGGLPRAPGGGIRLSVHVSPRLRPGASCRDARSCCHADGRHDKTHEMVPGRLQSFVAP